MNNRKTVNGRENRVARHSLPEASEHILGHKDSVRKLSPAQEYRLFTNRRISMAITVGIGAWAIWLLSSSSLLGGANGASDHKNEARAVKQEALGANQNDPAFKAACPDYRHYSFTPQ